LSIQNDIKHPFKSGNVLLQLIIVNVAVFLILNIFRIVFFMQGYSGYALDAVFQLKIGQWIDMPSRFDEFIYRPWTIFTYMFSHISVGHIFANMLVLFFAGNFLQQITGQSRILAIYIYGGLIGGALTIIFHSTIPVLYEHALPLIGASGSIMALVFATATLAPRAKVLFFFLVEVELIYLALGYLIVDLIGITYTDGIGHICHLGGALTGFLFVRLMQSGKDLSRGFNNVFYGITGVFKRRQRKPKMKVVKNTGTSKKVSTGEVTSKVQVQKRIDAILDKISKGGYESLSKEEKDYLFRHGKDV
jgi:membrane associated rhomboid family serine protease